MLKEKLFSKAERLISSQENTPASATDWRFFKIHDSKTIEVVVDVDCAGCRFQVPLLVNLESDTVDSF